MTTLESADDVLTLLVHLGYLTYDFYKHIVWISNQEAQKEFIKYLDVSKYKTKVKKIENKPIY